jgi:hypothetical protein
LQSDRGPCPRTRRHRRCRDHHAPGTDQQNQTRAADTRTVSAAVVEIVAASARGGRSEDAVMLGCWALRRSSLSSAFAGGVPWNTARRQN